MIAYFDASAIVPLVIDEDATERARAQWAAAARLVSVTLSRVEVHASLVRAERGGRLSREQRRTAARALDAFFSEVDFIAVDDDLIRTGIAVTEATGLRAYDAVHLAAAVSLNDADVVFVAGDRALLDAAAAAGLHTAATA